VDTLFDGVEGRGVRAQKLPGNRCAAVFEILRDKYHRLWLLRLNW
jgi:hypothetical protein